MSGLPLSREALARVLQSLLMAEWRASRGGSAGLGAGELPAVWPGSLRMLEGPGDGECLGLDSLEALRLGAAANEMFHLHESGHERDLLSAETWSEWLEVVEENWRAGVTRITFRSSGSSGTPHGCTHEMSVLGTEADYLAGLFPGRRRIVSHVQAHHIYGFLFTAMLADRLGCEAVAARRADGSVTCPGDLVVAVPEQWEWMERTVARWPDGIEGVTSTAPCPRGVIAGLMERGLGGMTEVYGSSETAGVGTRRWPEEAYRRMPHWRVAEDGTGCLIDASCRRVELMDRIAVRGKDGFVVEGRVDRGVQVGGMNVYPEKIAGMLRGRPGVEDAAVRLMRAGEGGRLKAFVVPAAGHCRTALEQELEAWVREHLTAPERPKSWAFGSALPVSAMGKPADW